MSKTLPHTVETHMLNFVVADNGRTSFILLTLPLPPKAVSPNARGHWSKKAKAVKEYRAMAEMEARRVVSASDRQGWAMAETTARFYFGTVRKRDEDNAAASLKAVWDGLVDAELVQNDSGLTHRRPELLIDRKRPRLEIELRRLGALLTLNASRGK